MQTLEARPSATAEALLRHSADWLWECDAQGCVTNLSGGRSPLPAALARSLQGCRFEAAGWTLAKQGGGPTSWPLLVSAGKAFEVLASVPQGGPPATFCLVAVPLTNDALGHVGFCGVARRVDCGEQGSPLPSTPAEASSAALVQFMSAMRIPCWVFDVETRAFLEVNAAAERVYGYSRAEFLAMNLADIRRPADAARLFALLEQRARGEDVVWPTHWIHRTRLGAAMAVTVEAVDVAWNGRTARMVLVTDITQHRSAEIEVKLLYECLESAGDIVVVTAAERDALGDRPILYVNRAFEERTGYTRAEVIGRDARLLQGRTTEPAVVRRVNHALGRWEPVKVEMVNYTRAGDPYWVEMAITPVADDRGWYHYWFAVERDITDRKLAEHALADANIELERRVAERTRELQHTVSDLESFNRMVSHDLQNPLNGVLGLSDLLQAKHGASLPADAIRMLHLIWQSADQMHHTLADLLSLSRISSMQSRPTPVDLSGLCAPMLTTLRGRHPQRALNFQVLQTAELHADLQLLQLAFQQLLDNAWKYSGKTAVASILIGARANADGVVVTVQDNGVGFDAAGAQALFSPFKRLRGTEGIAGTGIGLAIVARAVDRLGGWVWAEGQVGQGAHFHVFLPDRTPTVCDRPTLPGALSDGH